MEHREEFHCATDEMMMIQREAAKLPTQLHQPRPLAKRCAHSIFAINLFLHHKSSLILTSGQSVGQKSCALAIRNLDRFIFLPTNRQQKMGLKTLLGNSMTSKEVSIPNFFSLVHTFFSFIRF